MRRSLRAIVLALVVAAGLGSCGEEQQDTAAPRAEATSEDPELVVRRYFAGFARGDGRDVCALLTGVGRKGMQQLPEGERAGSCERAVAVLARRNIRVRRPEVRDIHISGRTATATVRSKDPAYESGILLRRDERGWKIAYPPAVLSRFDSPPGIRPHEDEDEHER